MVWGDGHINGHTNEENCQIVGSVVREECRTLEGFFEKGNFSRDLKGEQELGETAGG
jgi:hypothetical protein